MSEDGLHDEVGEGRRPMGRERIRALGDRILRAFAGNAWPREDAAFRDRHMALGGSDLDYAKVRPAYQMGFEAGVQERNRGHPFRDVEDALREEWDADYASQSGSWESVRGHVQRAYHRGQELVTGHRLE